MSDPRAKQPGCMHVRGYRAIITLVLVLRDGFSFVRCKSCAYKPAHKLSNDAGIHVSVTVVQLSMLYNAMIISWLDIMRLGTMLHCITFSCTALHYIAYHTDIISFIWGFDYTFTNYNFRTTINQVNS